MKTAMLISRILAGLVFIFSGFVKAIDPMGSAIKFEEYLLAFNLDFLTFVALPFAVFLSAVEFMIGLNLLAGLRMKLTAWLLLILMSFFTPLTLILALTNPVSDCGCFGDALKLTNWQTFWKNIILFAPALVIFSRRGKTNPVSLPQTLEWGLCGVNFLIAVLISFYGLRHQPVLDFRPYSTGTSIPEKMSVPPGAPVDKYETTLVYEKNGIRQEFTESNFPWQDTAWKWVETRQNLISKGYTPPIHDFTVTDENGIDITGQVLSDTNYTFLIISPFLHKASEQGMRRLDSLALKALKLGIHVFCLTSSTSSQVMAFKVTFQPSFDICTADETTLKTIMRANPGILLLKQGTILGKWNYRDAPLPYRLQGNMLPVILNRHRKTIETLSVVVLAFAVALFYSVVLGIRRR